MEAIIATIKQYHYLMKRSQCICAMFIKGYKVATNITDEERTKGIEQFQNTARLAIERSKALEEYPNYMGRQRWKYDCRRLWLVPKDVYDTLPLRCTKPKKQIHGQRLKQIEDAWPHYMKAFNHHQCYREAQILRRYGGFYVKSS